MSENPVVQGDDDPVYAEWDDEWAVPVDTGEPEPEPTRPAELVVRLSPAQLREQVTQDWETFRRSIVGTQFEHDTLLNGVQKIFSTSQAAAFFGRSNQWVYWGLRPDPETGEQVFTYKDGTPIQPERMGKGGRRRFTLPLIREIALSCYRRGNLTEEELQEVMARILIAEFGEHAFADAGKKK